MNSDNTILFIQLSHDASVCVSENGKIVYFNQEERLSHIKHSTSFVWRSLDYVFKKYKPKETHIVFCDPVNMETYLDYFEKVVTLCYSHFSLGDVYAHTEHHIFHAYNSFFESSFDSSAVLVVDGNGKRFYDEDDTREQVSIYKCTKDKTEAVYQTIVDEKSSHYGIARLWELVSEHFFDGDWFCAGKLMGASAYGENNPNHPKAYVNGHGNPEFINAVRNKEISFEDASYRLQNDSFDVICDLVEKTVELTGEKNMCLSGGYFQNCVNNFKLVKKYPDINFYVDPLSTDCGISSGVNKMLFSKNYEPTNTLYLGNQANYDRDLKENEKEYEISAHQVAQLIADKNIVAIYQGRSEAGHRALGNRSILYDPRDPNGRDHVNTIKKREYYRPFAGTVMLEHVHDWFDMASLKESPFMMYAVNTNPEKSAMIPALQHNDGSSRIQTVTKEQNENYYNLINEFYKITGIPMVLNTSFNLAGDTLVDNMDDALRTCRESGIKYLYCPERGMMIEL